jgi:hypothetical protein
VISQFFHRAHHRRVVPARSAAGVEQFLRGRGVGQRDTRLAGVAQRQVEALLGKSFGVGRAMMPHHDDPRTVWTYYIKRGSVNLGSGAVHDDGRYLFVFLVDGVFEGYMWFDSKVQ